MSLRAVRGDCHRSRPVKQQQCAFWEAEGGSASLQRPSRGHAVCGEEGILETNKLCPASELVNTQYGLVTDTEEQGVSVTPVHVRTIVLSVVPQSLEELSK